MVKKFDDHSDTHLKKKPMIFKIEIPNVVPTISALS